MSFQKDVIKLLRGIRISNIFSFRSHKTLKPRSKHILKIYFLFNSKLNGRKLGFNTPLRRNNDLASFTLEKIFCNNKTFWWFWVFLICLGCRNIWKMFKMKLLNAFQLAALLADFSNATASYTITQFFSI